MSVQNAIRLPEPSELDAETKPRESEHDPPAHARPLGYRDRSYYLVRERTSRNAGDIRMIRCPICGKEASEWDAHRAAKHLERNDHTWSRLVSSDD